MSRLTPLRMSALSSALGTSPSDLHRYAASQPAAIDLLHQLWNMFFGDGGSGSRSSRGRSISTRELQSLPPQLRESVHALQELTGETVRLQSPSARRRDVAAPQTQPGGRGSRGGSAAPPTAPAPAPAGGESGDMGGSFSSRAAPADTSRRTLPYQPTGLADDPSQSYFSDEFHAPTSSNVYSFQYFRRPRDTTGILYVTYKASAINQSGLRTGKARHKGGRQQLHGTPGVTVRGGGERPNSPGPTYAYYSVPPAIFNRMKQAHSKGKFVWDALRIRGTVYGHRYNYGLVVGQLLTNKSGEFAGQYIPRKATAKGFRSRSVADMGLGRRSFTSSTLPAKSFRTRSAPGGRTR